MLNKLLSIMLIVTLATMSGCVNNDTGNTLTKTSKYGDIELTMELEKTIFTEDDDINAMITLKNNGNQPITIKGLDTFDLGITFPEGSTTKFTYLNPEGSTDDEKTVETIEPGKSVTQEINWDQTYSTSDDEETIVDPGKYKLEAYVKAKISDNNKSVEPYTLKTDNITITIE